MNTIQVARIATTVAIYAQMAADILHSRAADNWPATLEHALTDVPMITAEVLDLHHQLHPADSVTFGTMYDIVDEWLHTALTVALADPHAA